MKAIISGATRGIGKAIAEAFSQANIDLILLAREAKTLEKLKSDLQHSKCEVVCLAIDLTAKEMEKQLRSEIANPQDVELLVNNVGWYAMNSASETKPSELQKQLDINLYPAIQLSNFILPYFIEKSAGRIVNIGSIMSLHPAPFASNYSISKHALKAWNDTLREEQRANGIQVNAIYPGAVNTSSWDGQDANREAMIQPEDIAQLILSIIKLGPTTSVDEIRLSPLQF